MPIPKIRGLELRLALQLGFGLGLGKDCYPYFSGGWVGGWVVGGIETKASPLAWL